MKRDDTERADRPRLSVRIMLRFSASRSLDGLWIGTWETEAEPILHRIEQALLLIKRYDRIRYDRLLRDLQRVWVLLLPSSIASFEYRIYSLRDRHPLLPCRDDDTGTACRRHRPRSHPRPPMASRDTLRGSAAAAHRGNLFAPRNCLCGEIAERGGRARPGGANARALRHRRVLYQRRIPPTSHRRWRRSPALHGRARLARAGLPLALGDTRLHPARPGAPQARGVARSFRLDVGELHDLRPFLGFTGDVACEFGWRHRIDDDAQVEEPRLELRIGKPGRQPPG